MKKIILCCFVAFLIACTYKNEYINREKDNNEGKLFLNEFYKEISNKEFENVDTLVGDSLKKLAGSNGISKMVKFINNKAGDYRSYLVDDYYVRCVTCGFNETYYNYKLKVSYDKGTIVEIIGLRKQDGAKIKINSYHANSDLLMK